MAPGTGYAAHFAPPGALHTRPTQGGLTNDGTGGCKVRHTRCRQFWRAVRRITRASALNGKRAEPFLATTIQKRMFQRRLPFVSGILLSGPSAGVAGLQDGVQRVVGNANAFVALKEGGEVVVWGDAEVHGKTDPCLLRAPTKPKAGCSSPVDTSSMCHNDPTHAISNTGKTLRKTS